MNHRSIIQQQFSQPWIRYHLHLFTRFRMEMIALLDQFRQVDRRRGTWRRDIARRSNWEGKKEGRREDRLEATVFHRARRGFLNEERSFGSLIYTAAKLKRMRRPGPRLQISAGSSARRRVSHARKKRTRIPRGKERGDYIVIREECWLDPSAGRVLALLPSLNLLETLFLSFLLSLSLHLSYASHSDRENLFEPRELTSSPRLVWNFALRELFIFPERNFIPTLFALGKD